MAGRPRKDLTGHTFGLLTVLGMEWRPFGAHPTHKQGWARCQCQCGKAVTVPSSSLIRGERWSCGCEKAANLRKDYTGQRFGKLVVQHMQYQYMEPTLAICQCDCGHRHTVRMHALVSLGQRSCGCSRQEKTTPQHRRERMRLKNQRRRDQQQSLAHTLREEHITFMLQYWHFACAICGREDGGLWHFIALDHWIPLSHKDCPGTVPTNILPLCHGKKGARKLGGVGGCNNRKRAKDPWLWLRETLGLQKARKKQRDIEAYFTAISQLG